MNTSTNGKNPQPSSQSIEIAKVDTAVQAVALVPTSIDGAYQLARWLSNAQLLPPDLRGKEADIFTMVLAGMELGLPPLAALRGMYIVKGKPALEAKTKAAICLQRGAAEYFKKTEDTPLAVTWETRRKGDADVRRSRYTLEEAKAAGLADKEGPWRHYRQRMLSWKALGWLCDDAYPDVVLGVSTKEDFDEAEVQFSPIAAVAPGVELGHVKDSPAHPLTPARAAVENAKVGQPVTPSSAAPSGPSMTEDEATEIEADFKKTQNKPDLRKIAAERVTPRVMSEAIRERLAKAFEDHWHLIDDAEKQERPS